MKKAEKIDIYHRATNAKKFNKKLVKRARRRAEKRDPENAGKNVNHFIRGWMS